MNNRQDIIFEYQTLIRKLNLSNRLKNQKTEIKFFELNLADGAHVLAVTTNNESYLTIGTLSQKNWLKT